VALNVSAVLVSAYDEGCNIIFSNVTINNFTSNSTTGTVVNTPDQEVQPVIVNITRLSLEGNVTLANTAKGSIIYAMTSLDVYVRNVTCGGFSLKYVPKCFE
jgi:hypothetical protein